MSQEFDYQKELSKCSTMADITGPDGLVQKIIKDAVGREISEHITSEKEKGNQISRNGTSHKTVKTPYGAIGLDVPRLREPGFEPEIIKKRAVVEEGLESQVISMYAKGMTVRDIAEHLQALYGIELSAASISNITDKVSDEAKEWYSRTLVQRCTNNGELNRQRYPCICPFEWMRCEIILFYKTENTFF